MNSELWTLYVIDGIAAVLVLVLGLPWWLQERRWLLSYIQRGYYVARMRRHLRKHYAIGAGLAALPVLGFASTFLLFNL